MINVILCLSIAYLFLRTKQMQYEIRDLTVRLSSTTTTPTPTCDGDGDGGGIDEIDPVLTTASQTGPVDTVPKVQELSLNVTIEEEDAEDESLRCELRAQGETCKGSTKELKKRIKEKKVAVA